LRESAAPSSDPKDVQRKDSGLGLSFSSRESNDGKIVFTGLVLPRGCRPAGYSQASAVAARLSNGRWLLTSLWVDRGVKGKGLDSELFHKTMTELKKKGCKTVIIDPAVVDFQEGSEEGKSLAELRTTSTHRFFCSQLGAVYNEADREYTYTIPNS
jgi:predicted GNAT family acetyltransferase